MSQSNRSLVLRTAIGLLLIAIILCAFSARAGEPWKFIVCGDSRGKDNGVNTEILGPLAQQIAKTGADLVLFTGDSMTGSLLQSTSKKYLDQWRAAMTPVYKAGIKVYPIAGNHEWIYYNLPEVWRKEFPELPDNGPKGEEKMTYSFTHKNALVIGLDQYSGHRHEVDQKWLNKQLAARDAKAQPHVFVFGHEPAYAALHADCMDNDEQARDAFIQSLVYAGGRFYFCGHDHFYDHAEIRGFLRNNQPVAFHQLIAGTAGAPVYHWKGQYGGKNGLGKTVVNVGHDEHWGGYCQVDVDDLKVTMNYVKRQDNGEYAIEEIFLYTIPSQ
jgi:Calcineurin-like phosphoesterase